MQKLTTILEDCFGQSRAEISELLAAHGDLVIDEVRLGQVLGGMRGMHCIVCDTSSVDPSLGLLIRGRPVIELQDASPEEVFWLLLTGCQPDSADLQELQGELEQRSGLPGYIRPLLAAMPADSHPMTMFNAALLAMQHESHFARSYHSTKKSELWRPALEDALDLLARMPLLAALVYRQRYGLPDVDIPASTDWTSGLALGLLGREDPQFRAMLKRYVVVQSDHENGNVCALAGHVTGSTLADLYYAISAGLNGLAGHIHGLAAQDFVRFLDQLSEELGIEAEDEQIRTCLEQRLAAGRVIPGFGHAVLRLADPRFEILYGYAAEQYLEHPSFRLASRVYRAGTKLLQDLGRAKNPYPNVDAITGVLLRLSGIPQLEFYTVLFGVSLSIGMLAQNVVSRGIGSPIVRPRSIPLAELRAASRA
ncbi:MAG: citrate (Si)-synthase [bacterium]